MYGLHTILSTRIPFNGHFTQYLLGSAFEAWMAAAYLDAKARGPDAVAEYDQALEQLFSLETWADMHRTLSGQKATAFSAVPAGQRMSTPMNEIGAEGRTPARATLTGHPARDFLAMRKESAMRTFTYQLNAPASGGGATFDQALGGIPSRPVSAFVPSATSTPSSSLPPAPNPTPAAPITDEYRSELDEAMQLLAEAQSTINIPLMAPLALRKQRQALEDGPTVFLDLVKSRIQ